MISVSTEDTSRIAQDFIKKNINNWSENGVCIVALSGDLGSGKTTFTQAVAKILGVYEQITSPTFVIEKIYKVQSTVFTHLIHIDAYRIESPRELEVLGWREISTDSKNLILIEWPEKIESLLPSNYIKISFKFIDDTTRDIVWENRGWHGTDVAPRQV